MAGLVNPPEQEPALPVVVVPAELHQQRLLVQADPPLSGLVDLNTAILLSSFTSYRTVQSEILNHTIRIMKLCINIKDIIMHSMDTL